MIQVTRAVMKLSARRRKSRRLGAICSRTARDRRGRIILHQIAHHPMLTWGLHALGRLGSAAFYVGLARLALGCILESGSTSSSPPIACPLFAASCHVDTGRQSALEIAQHSM